MKHLKDQQNQVSKTENFCERLRPNKVTAILKVNFFFKSQGKWEIGLFHFAKDKIRHS